MCHPPILVTGAHRSGTTWVGRVLSFCPGVMYVHEPFNLHEGQCSCGARFQCWYQYIHSGNESEYYEHLCHCLALKGNLLCALGSARSGAQLKRAAKEYAKHLKYRLASFRPLMKDPIALFSAEWLATRFNMQVVVMIRHPAAFAASLKRAAWEFPFDHLLNQQELMDQRLCGFREEIERFANEKHDIVDQAVLLWKITHTQILGYKKRFTDWIFVRHEDICHNPTEMFQSLCERLGLRTNGKVRKEIERLSAAENPVEIQGDTMSIERNSKAIAFDWKNRLSDDEIEKIRKGVEGVSEEFYSTEQW